MGRETAPGLDGEGSPNSKEETAPAVRGWFGQRSRTQAVEIIPKQLKHSWATPSPPDATLLNQEEMWQTEGRNMSKDRGLTSPVRLRRSFFILQTAGACNDLHKRN
jgi:hypothetical protein